jgi:F-type H+-transporting ATPase subunit b
MKIDWWTLALQAINVLVLIWLLGHFLYKPVLAAIAARQAAADKLLSDAEVARAAAAAESAALKAQADTLAAEAGEQRKAVVAAAEVSAQALLKKAEDEANARATRAEAALAQERQAAGEAVQAQAAELATSIAGKLLGRLSSEVVTEAMFVALLDKIKGLPGAPVTEAEILTAIPLSEADQAQYHDRLAAVLGHPLATRFTVDASLIAGFELHGAGVLVTNSWRADLVSVGAQISA